MTNRTHDAFAFASLVTAAVYYPPTSLNITTVGISLVGNIVGGLIPDMDQATNRLWDLLPAGNLVGRIFRRIFIKHRTLSHSLIGIFLVFKLLEWLLPKVLNPQFVDIRLVFWAIMIGYLSHLLADSFTKEGLPLFFPLPLTVGIPPISSLRITTDSWIEKFFVLPGILVYLIWFVNNHKTELISMLRLIHS